MNQQRKFFPMTKSSAIWLLYSAALLLMSSCMPVTRPSELATEIATQVVTEANDNVALCPEIERPALPLMLADDSYALFDPIRGASCALALDKAIPGMVVMVQDDFFVARHTVGAEGDAIVIVRYRGNGTLEELPYTLTDAQAGFTLVAFTVTDNARYIAWSVLGPTAGSELYATSLYIADLETGKLLLGVAPETDDAPRALLPIRFSNDGSILFYAHQPYGLGGIWSSYDARYDNLYAIALDGSGSHKPIFDCANFDHALCLGDFYLKDNRVMALAYVERGAKRVVIQDGNGHVLNTLTTTEEYIGYPTWGSGGELVYYTAALSKDTSTSAAPAMGYLYRVSPITAAAQTLVSNTALLLPIRFLSDTKIIASWAGVNDTRSLALIGVDGSIEMLKVPEGASLLDGVSAISTLLGTGGRGGMVSLP